MLLPNNKVSIIRRAATYCDISCYSNSLEKLLGWRAKGGSKYKQNVRVPDWIRKNTEYTIICLRGLFETDGSIYLDRGYKMANFVTIIPNLAKDVLKMIKDIGFEARLYCIKTKPVKRYTIRISKNVNNFIDTIGLKKD